MRFGEPEGLEPNRVVDACGADIFLLGGGNLRVGGLITVAPLATCARWLLSHVGGAGVVVQIPEEATFGGSQVSAIS